VRILLLFLLAPLFVPTLAFLALYFLLCFFFVHLSAERYLILARRFSLVIAQRSYAIIISGSSYE
jgi:hypothetical protein